MKINTLDTALQGDNLPRLIEAHLRNGEEVVIENFSWSMEGEMCAILGKQYGFDLRLNEAQTECTFMKKPAIPKLPKTVERGGKVYEIRDLADDGQRKIAVFLEGQKLKEMSMPLGTENDTTTTGESQFDSAIKFLEEGVRSGKISN